MTSVGTQRVQSTTDSVAEHVSQLSTAHYQLVKDTVAVLDSVVLETRNDTVFHTRWRTEYHDRVVERIDTVEVRDTVELRHSAFGVSHSETETVQVERRVPPWCWWLLIWNIIALVLWLAWRIYKFKF